MEDIKLKKIITLCSKHDPSHIFPQIMDNLAKKTKKHKILIHLTNELFIKLKNFREIIIENFQEYANYVIYPKFPKISNQIQPQTQFLALKFFYHWYQLYKNDYFILISAYNYFIGIESLPLNKIIIEEKEANMLFENEKRLCKYRLLINKELFLNEIIDYIPDIRNNIIEIVNLFQIIIPSPENFNVIDSYHKGDVLFSADDILKNISVGYDDKTSTEDFFNSVLVTSGLKKATRLHGYHIKSFGNFNIPLSQPSAQISNSKVLCDKFIRENLNERKHYIENFIFKIWRWKFTFENIFNTNEEISSNIMQNIKKLGNTISISKNLFSLQKPSYKSKIDGNCYITASRQCNTSHTNIGLTNNLRHSNIYHIIEKIAQDLPKYYNLISDLKYSQDSQKANKEMHQICTSWNKKLWNFICLLESELQNYIFKINHLQGSENISKSYENDSSHEEFEDVSSNHININEHN
ncbi:uncharacterized protein LOC135925475 isoform X3 [Gordionus sp. m RMFG-2023]